jgi:putative ABC transport system permease protein
MIKNYLLTALRTLSRNKGYALINVLGLITGISFSCMLYLYVSHELSYDKFHPRSDRMARVITVDQRDPANVQRYGVTVPAMGPELLNNYPEVVAMVRLYRVLGQVVFEIDGQNFQERNWYSTDSNFFEVFDFEFLHGDKATALGQPHSLVLTESMAKKYFGDRNPVGEVIEKTSFGPVKITGVIRDQPDNSHLKFDLLFSAISTDDRWKNYLNSWEQFNAHTYLVLDDKTAIRKLMSKLPALAENKFARFDGGVTVDVQPLEDIYLGSSGIQEGAESEKGQMSYIYIFSSMAILLLLIASMNYVNLATSKAMARSREVGVRKVVGARRGQLMAQFLAESFIITFLSALLAVFVMDLAFPYFNQITGKQFDVTFESLRSYVFPLAAIALIIGLVSGSYPAFYLAQMKPVSSLRGREEGARTTGLRKVLVVFQFVITIVMIVSTLVTARQLDFVGAKDLGFNKERLVVIDINNGDVRSQFRTVKNEYLSLAGVEQVAVSSRVPGEWKDIAELYVSSTESPATVPDSIKTYFMGFDEDMLSTYRLNLLQGRYFSPDVNDSTSILLNESAVTALGLTTPIGTTVRLKEGNDVHQATVIGVIRDFNFQSLHQKVAPIIIGAWNNPFQSIDYFTLKISGDTEKVIREVTRIHEKFDQRTPIEYHFLEEQLNTFYVAEQRAGMIFRMAGVLSVVVACLGLLGLATYNIQRRTKELGIRKILGASGSNLFLLLSSSLVKQVTIAFFIATPLAWYLMKEWLEAFEYRISLHAGIFLVAGVVALVIALATVAYRTLKAVRVNPVDTLRQE